MLQKTAAFVVFLFASMAASALELKGDWQQGGVIVGKVPQGTLVEYRGKKLQISPAGEFVIGLGRDAARHAKIITISSDGLRQEHEFAVKQRTYNIQKVTGVPQRTVDPDPAQVERAKREAQMSADARKGDLPLTFFAQKFIWPLIGPISGVYGSQRFYNGVPNSPHYGVDIAKPVGTLVKAPAGGVVTLVHPDMFFSGGTLIIDHGHGLSSTFIHLSEVLVKKGDAITQGQIIAKVGKTGRATGPHLDWRMNWFEERVDPQLLVEPMPE
ncbi:M23 family metallopeptidase [Cellvibrio sp. OA-2007]|uniref:M23 family metallopeptidase n=1 Tax=Cellvibrio sp. OA-2007 TaxID=529823 RepID=UPI0007837F62|nr:M23 family metallopeptidase [Cellvibrio sp. OA-2007]